MAKILYIEDEITVSGIRSLFSNIIQKKSLEELCKLAKDEHGGADVKKIKEILAPDPFVNVEHNFIEALKTIENDKANEYTLFIVDRNLSKSKYSETDIPDEIKEYCKNGWEWEGDCIFEYLKAKGKINISDRNEDSFYFFTAYPPGDISELKRFHGIRATEYIEKHVIDKNHEQKIIQIIKRQVPEYLHKKHEEIYKLHNYGLIKRDKISKLENMLSEIGDDTQNLKDLRDILEEMCTALLSKGIDSDIYEFFKVEIESHIKECKDEKCQACDSINRLENRERDRYLIYHMLAGFCYYRKTQGGKTEDKVVTKQYITKSNHRQSDYLYKILSDTHLHPSEPGFIEHNKKYLNKGIIYTFLDFLMGINCFYDEFCKDKKKHDELKIRTNLPKAGQA